MNKESEIISMLQSIIKTLDEHGRKLDKHDKRFESINKRLGTLKQTQDNQSATLQEHGQILTALRSGQEYLKAEMDGMKVSNAKEFGMIKNQLEDQSAKMEILKDETWSNKVDIHRIKNTMGLK
ncbi:hypothetical protein GLV94_13605 [Virgibacillus halodenitrificans]|uniref:hypothetical protein n=1 Tax=Virgibacillus halodenitrificans TaxID=1482 RepID=UPI001371B5E6|nr:hypothetical protein [Virgibacillus halodenitrificans]MYL46681.1 hypothetical protein [Virgibacillus halodenitrificans]